MTYNNFVNALQAYANRRPFRSFRVELVNGNDIEVTHPEALSMRGPAAMFIRPDGGFQILDNEGVCQFIDLERDQFLPESF